MLFDAGRYGMLKVDAIIGKTGEEEQRQLGVVHLKDLSRVTYVNWGKRGCAKIVSHLPEDISPQARAAQEAGLLALGEMIVSET